MSNPPEDDRARWNARYSDAGRLAGRAEEADPPGVFQRLTDAAGLPRSGLAVDLAGGDGRGAIWLAEMGLAAIVVDVSDVALSLATEQAVARGVSLRTHQMDLTHASLADVLAEVNPQGTGLTVVSCMHYLNRDLLRSVAAGLPAGAVFMASIATTANLERNQRPSARFLLEPGELLTLVGGDREPGRQAGGLELLHCVEGWNEHGANEAELVVRAV